MMAKWNLDHDEYFEKRFRDVGLKRKHYVGDFVARHVLHGALRKPLADLYNRMDALIDPLITQRYAKRQTPSYE